MPASKSTRPIRLGVVGVGRGAGFARGAPTVGMEVVAICDTWKEKLKEHGKALNVATYTDFDKFLDHDMDAVALANYFHEHAPLAIKTLDAGKHVLSETSACKTLGEGVALARAVESSKRTYMFGENYIYMAYIQEMRRLYQAGEIGEAQLTEGEYIHPVDSRGMNQLAPGMNHWRNWIPSTYYCTHGLGPLMYVTDTMPVSVIAQSIPRSSKDKENLHVRRVDPGSVIVCRMDNEGVATVNGLMLRGHGNWYRFHGTRGLMENLRTHGEHGKLRIVHEPWDCKPGDVHEKIYSPEFPIKAELARQAGHGGGDFFVLYNFAEAIRKGEPPWCDIYRGLAMSVVGIQAWRSALANGAPHKIPDFSKEQERAKHENDHWSPFPEDAAHGQPPPSINGWRKPTAKQSAAAREVWEEMGYEGE